jgi:RND family efflux transporter MFP subunit
MKEQQQTITVIEPENSEQFESTIPLTFTTAEVKPAPNSHSENSNLEDSEHFSDSSLESVALPVIPTKKRAYGKIVVLFLILVLLTIAYVERAKLQTWLFTYISTNPSVINTSTSQTNATDKIKVLYWQDPMHPAYKSDKPGKAPDCGMDLIPIYDESINTTPVTNLPPGAFNISPTQQQLIGVQYGEVAYKTVNKTIRTVGKLAYDETKITHVHTKTDGWIEDVYVDFTGKQIKKGEPLFSVYSPDLLASQQEFLIASRSRKELGESQFREAALGSQSLYQASRRRLELWDISDEQINEIEKSGKPVKNLTVYAPIDGFILSRNAYPKQRIMPDTDLYTIADLSNIWVIADVYEYEVADVKLGQETIVTLSYFPGRVFRGKINYIYPQIDTTTRTLKVRIEIANPTYELKPDMFANVELKINYGRKLTVPQEAVLDSGSEQNVFVALGNGYFEPRKIQLGTKVDNNFIVLAGLKSGEKVVTSANFLIDSESRLKSAMSGMGMGHSHGGMAPTNNSSSKPIEDHSQHQQSTPNSTPMPQGHSHF